MVETTWSNYMELPWLAQEFSGIDPEMRPEVKRHYDLGRVYYVGLTLADHFESKPGFFWTFDLPMIKDYTVFHTNRKIEKFLVETWGQFFYAEFRRAQCHTDIIKEGIFKHQFFYSATDCTHITVTCRWMSEGKKYLQELRSMFDEK